MTTSRTGLMALAGALLLFGGATWGWSRRSSDPRPAAAESFRPSDVALIGHTGLPQLVEFYHPG